MSRVSLVVFDGAIAKVSVAVPKECGDGEVVFGEEKAVASGRNFVTDFAFGLLKFGPNDVHLCMCQ